MTAPFTYAVFPVLAVNGKVMQWNAVIYDMRYVVRTIDGKPQYKFVTRTERASSPEAAAKLAEQRIALALR